MTAAIAFPVLRLGRAAETPLRNLVLLMRENRSFDHYFGHFPGADGLPPDAPAKVAALTCSSDPPHNNAAFQSLAGGGPYNSAGLEVFTEQQIPSAWALARRFTLCDRYFASILGPTFPNRLFSITGSTGGARDNPRRIDPTMLPRPNLMDRLDAAGVQWACYLAKAPDTGGYNPIAFYPERVNEPRSSRTFQDFLADAAAGRLPPVSWVIPQDPLTEHPPTPPQWGQRFADLVVHALASGPQWKRSALILNYDESGGFYDHVTPPPGYGFRVPCTVVSPFAKPGHVSHSLYDHASVMALIERTFGLAPVAERDAKADPMSDCFDFGRAHLTPVTFPALPLVSGCAVPPDWAEELLDTPLPAPGAATAPAGQRFGWATSAGVAAGGASAAAGGVAFWLLRRSRHDDT